MAKGAQQVANLQVRGRQHRVFNTEQMHNSRVLEGLHCAGQWACQSSAPANQALRLMKLRLTSCCKHPEDVMVGWGGGRKGWARVGEAGIGRREAPLEHEALVNTSCLWKLFVDHGCSHWLQCRLNNQSTLFDVIMKSRRTCMIWSPMKPTTVTWFGRMAAQGRRKGMAAMHSSDEGPPASNLPALKAGAAAPCRAPAAAERWVVQRVSSCLAEWGTHRCHRRGRCLFHCMAGTASRGCKKSIRLEDDLDALAGWLGLHLSQSNNTMTGPRVAHTAGLRRQQGDALPHLPTERPANWHSRQHPGVHAGN